MTTDPDRCRAVVFGGDGTYELREFAVPSPPPGGAVLRVEAVGMCASDVAQLHGHKHVPGEVSPTVPGHEIVGRVHALDPGADLGVAVGDRVGVDLVRRCGTCAVCRSGSPYCENMRVVRLQLRPRRALGPVRRVRRVHGDPAGHPARPAARRRAPGGAVAVRAARELRALERPAGRDHRRRDGRDPGARTHGPDLHRARPRGRRGARSWSPGRTPTASASPRPARPSAPTRRSTSTRRTSWRGCGRSRAAGWPTSSSTSPTRPS